MRDEWPTFAQEGNWPATYDYLRLIVQMVGKLRLALAPPLPEWAHAALALSPTGVTTNALATGAGAIEVTLDVHRGVIRVTAAGGASHAIPISPSRPIADIWTDYLATLAAVGVTAELWSKPQERSDTTPFGVDHRPREYDPALALGWWNVLVEVVAWFDAWRSSFFGRSSVNFWWGGFDSSVVLFNGRHAVPPAGSNYLGRYELDAEHLSVGFWPGGAKRRPMFFAYIVPKPAGYADYDLRVPGAAWDQKMDEWVLPYETVRASDDGASIVRTFMDAIYRAAGDLAGWDLPALSYVRP